MKIVTLGSTIVLASLFVMLSTSALAQRSPLLSADVPFDFYLKGKKIPAGEYTVERVNRDSTQAIMVLRRKSDGSSVAMITGLLSDVRPGRDAAAPVLTFDRIALNYHLSGIYNPAGNYSARFPRRKRAGNEIGQLSVKPETVSIGLRR